MSISEKIKTVFGRRADPSQEREDIDRLVEKRADSILKSPNDGVSIQGVLDLVKQREISPEDAKLMFTSAMHKNAERADHPNAYVASIYSENKNALEWAVNHVGGNEPKNETTSEIIDQNALRNPSIPLNTLVEVAESNDGLRQSAVEKLLAEAREGNLNAIDEGRNNKISDEFTVAETHIRENAICEARDEEVKPSNPGKPAVSLSGDALSGDRDDR